MAFKDLDNLLQEHENVHRQHDYLLDRIGMDAGQISIRYAIFVGTLAKDMGSPQQDLVHMAVGISGEAGELLGAIKKHWAYNKPLDRANVIEELGDLEFYMQGMRLLLGISRQEVLEANYQKLKARYGDSYSDEKAQARADKAPGD